MLASVSPTPLMLTSRVRLAHSSGSLSIVSAMAWSTASSWDVKCWIVALASDSALSSAMPLVLRFFHSVKPATVPARIVWSSHNRRRAGEGGVQGRGLNSSAYSRMWAASTGSVLLRPSLVRATACCTDGRDGLRGGPFLPFGCRLHAAQSQCCSPPSYSAAEATRDQLV